MKRFDLLCVSVSLVLTLAPVAQAKRVIDLESQEIRGQFRGPELQWIETGQVPEETAGRIFYSSLKELEGRLLTAEPLPAEKGSRPPRSRQEKKR